jgi:hypothetical protein
MTQQSEEPLVTFFQTFPGAPAPREAEALVFGALPAKAAHYCEPVTRASGFGWYLYPPTDFALLWDGTVVYWKLPGARDWTMLAQALAPGYQEEFRRHAPAPHDDLGPAPFLVTAGELPGLVQVWPGVIGRTRPGWPLLVRPPANLPRHPQFDVYEGIIESDWWFGPLLSNIRLCSTNQPIEFRPTRPLFQVQPVLKSAYREQAAHPARVVCGLDALAEADWQAYREMIRLRHHPGAKLGSYKAEVRRREKRTASGPPV